MVASDAEVDLVVNATRALAEVERDLDRLVREAERGADAVQLRAILDQTASATRLRGELDDLVHQATRAAPDVTLHTDVDTDTANRNLGRLVGTFGRVAGASTSLIGPLASVSAGVAATGAAAAAAVPVVAGLVAVVESILPATAVAVSGLLTLSIAQASLKLGFMGLKDTIDAAFDPDTKPEDLAKAMSALAPQARAFVKQLRSLKSTFDALQLDVQDRLFQGLNKTLATTARSVLPSLERGLDSAASSFNTMAKGAASAARDLAQRGVLGAAVRSSENALRSLQTAPGQIVTSLGVLAAAAGPSLERLASAAAGAATRVSESLATAFASGALENSIKEAIDNIAQIGRIVGNVFGGLGNLFSIFDIEGQGVLSVLEKLSQAFEDFTAGDALSGLLSDVVTLIRPFGVLGLELAAQILPLLGPAFEDLAGIFKQVIEVLRPFVDLAFQLAAAVLPALNPILDGLREILTALQPVAEQLAENIGLLLKPVLEQLPGILDLLIPKFVEIAQKIFPALTKALEEIAPHLGELGLALADLLIAVLPLAEKFLEFQLFLLEKFGPEIKAVGGFILKFFISVIDALVLVIRDFLIPIIKTIVAIFEGDWIASLQRAAQFVGILRDNAGAAFNKLKDIALRAISTLVSGLIEKAQQVAVGFTSKINQLVEGAVRLVSSLPSRLLGALGNVASLLFSAGSSIVQGLINGITSKIGELVSTLSSITNLIPDLKGPLDVDKVLLTPSGEAIMDGLIKGIQSQVPALRQELSGITTIIPSAIGTPLNPGTSLDSRAPQVNVYLGNQLLNKHIDVRVDTANRRDARVSAQGMRR